MICYPINNTSIKKAICKLILNVQKNLIKSSLVIWLNIGKYVCALFLMANAH